MLDIQKLSPLPDHVAVDGNVAALASGAIAAVIATGARIFITQPWRVARIIHEADGMTVDELAGHMLRRRRAGPPADLNLAIALAQLSLALKSPQFHAVWTSWRLGRLPQ